MEILTVENLSFRYPLCTENALNNVSFSVKEGDFIVLCGATGSGKSTLLRLLKKELSPLGKKSGEILFKGTKLSLLNERVSASEIGFVAQNPNQQIVTDKVWHELAFGLENLGADKATIRARVCEMACYFGIEELFDMSVNHLSGGQKQLLNLASVMVMQPKLLVLDEPTAQLDPIAASDFMATVKKLSNQLSLTIILAEHKPEEAIPDCDKLLILNEGEVLCYDTPKKAAGRLFAYPKLLMGMPASVRLFNSLKKSSESIECPLSIKEGRRFLEAEYNNEIKELNKTSCIQTKSLALELSDVYFRYERRLPDVMRGTSFSVQTSELFCILGGNGSGKTTALGVIAGINHSYAGTIKLFGKKITEYKNQALYKNCVALLPQEVQTLFMKNTVKEELNGISPDILPYDFTPLYKKHPYDLSGGQQQLLALLKVLSTKPKLLLLDEPTKGLDAYAKSVLAEILLKLKADGITIVCVTHDIEFAAEYADRVAMFFRGEIVSVSKPEKFFSENSFYTTAAARMTKGFFDNAITVKDVKALCEVNQNACNKK